MSLIEEKLLLNLLPPTSQLKVERQWEQTSALLLPLRKLDSAWGQKWIWKLEAGIHTWGQKAM